MIRLYRLGSVRFGARELASSSPRRRTKVLEGLRALEKGKGVVLFAVENHRLENEADRVHQDA